MVIAANARLNLIARGKEKELIARLVSDSLALLDWEAVTLRGPVLDIGTGAGIPGMPLAIARPDVKFVLLDSIRKKTLFLRRVVAELGLKNVEIVCERASGSPAPIREDGGSEPTCRRIGGAPGTGLRRGSLPGVPRYFPRGVSRGLRAR